MTAVASRTVKVVIEAAVTGAIANVKAFGGAVREMGSELDRAAAKHPERLNKISSATGMLGIGAAVALGAITKVAMDFDRQMSAVVAVSDDGAKSLGALRQAALDAGRDTAYTATQAAQAEEELAKAGVSTKDILGGALAGTMNLAAAGTLDLGEAATVAAEAMTEFALSGKDVGHIADVLTAGANKSTADVQGLGMALGQVGGVAHQTGLSLEDTVGVLSAFTQAGMNGEEAGTTLKQMLLQLQAPSQEAAGIMKQLGINIYDAHGQFIGITKVADNLQQSLGNLDQAQRNAALGTIFGSRAIRGATVLYQQGASGIGEWIDGVNQSGIAAQTAAQKQDNLAGDLHKLLGSLQAVAIQSSGGTNAGLRDLTQGAEGALNAFLGLPKPVQETAVVLLAVSAAGLLATSGVLRMKTTVAGAMEALRGIGPAGAMAADGLGKIGSAAGKLALAGIAIGFAWEGAKLIEQITGVGQASKVATHDVDAMSNALAELGHTGQTTGELKKVFGENLRDLRTQMEQMADVTAKLNALNKGNRFAQAGSDATGGGAAAAKRFLLAQQAQLTQNIQDMDKALASLTQNGSAAVARAALVDLAHAAGVPIDVLLAKLPEYQKATDAAAAATTPLAQGFGSVAANADIMSRGLQDAIDHGMTLKDVFQQLDGAAVGVAKSEDKLYASFDNADKVIKENGKTLDVHTEKGRNNREALLGIVDATEQAVEATYNQTGSLDEASKTLEVGRQALIRAAVAAGYTKAQAQALADQWLKLPPAVATQVNTPGADAAIARLDRIQNRMDQLDGSVAHVTIVTADERTSLRGNLAGGVYEHAAVGVLRDAGLYSPVGPARYAFAEPSTQGEAFIPRRSADMARSRGIADYVVSNWLGGSVSWGGAAGAAGTPGAGGGQVQVQLVLSGGDAATTALLSTLHKAVNSRGGDVQLAVMGRPSS